MLQSELSFLLALAVSLAISALVASIMWRPLVRVLLSLYGTEQLAGFWTSFSAIFMVLLPTAAVMIGRSDKPIASSLFFEVIDQSKWGLLGLLGAMLIVALGVATFAQHSTGRVYVSPDQVTDLERLLGKVDEIRSHHILRRGPERGQTGA
jgi:hypothetical protein